MKKIFKLSAKILLIMLGIIVLIIIISYTNHLINLKKEKAILTPPGQIVKVNGHDMHVFTEDKRKNINENDDYTIVFMAGGGTSSPTYDFKALYSQLSDKYKIAIVEKAGYGYSETAYISRDIETILYETRRALEISGQKGPYILMPHSMSGIEAIYWAQQYPKEVKAIIGLDSAVPQTYKDYKMPSKFIVGMSTFGARIGFTRFISSIVNNSSAIQSGALTPTQIDIYKALFYNKTMTSNMNDELKQIKRNASKVLLGGVPTKTPMYFFISDGKETGVKNWQWKITDYSKQVEHSEYTILDCGHYVHNYEPKLIADKTVEFIKSIK